MDLEDFISFGAFSATGVTSTGASSSMLPPSQVQLLLPSALPFSDSSTTFTTSDRLRLHYKFRVLRVQPGREEARLQIQEVSPLRFHLWFSLLGLLFHGFGVSTTGRSTTFFSSTAFVPVLLYLFRFTIRSIYPNQFCLQA